MKVMGLDPSTRRTGWAVIEDDALVACGTVPLTSHGWQRLAVEEKCFKIAREIGDLVREYEPGFCYQERAVVCHLPGGHTNLKAALILGHLGGAIAQEIAMSRDGLRACLVTPTEWQKLLGIGGQGKKCRLAYVQGWCSLHGVPFASYSEDEIEAIGIALAGTLELSR